MSEEEIINVVRDYINYIRFNEKAKYSINQWQMATEDLLDLYNKEKEKNAKLEKDLKHKNDLIKQADKDLECEYVHIEELDKEKEKNKELKNALVDMVNQFAYEDNNPKTKGSSLERLYTGGLSALENVFSVLDINEGINRKELWELLEE